MAATLRVGAVACPATVNAVEDNFAAAAVWAARAAGEKIDLLLFPELSLTGYATAGPPAAPLSAGHPACRRMGGLAAEFGLVLAAGLAWEEEGAKYLAHGLWLPDGAFHLYKKTHLGQRERNEYAAGDRLPVFPLPGVTVGIQLCLEQHFPEIAQTLVLKGAQIILCPHATPRLGPDERRESWHISLRARAYDNCVYVLAANQVGDNGQGTVYHGGALLVSPAGKVLAEDFSGKPAMITGEIDLDQVIDVRTTPQGMCRRFYALERRPDLYE
ncbi:nitrilase-related carbon-nitrogen hydrolase [Anaeroselena agilis]|uniref:Nitrilase-related carbon-nitrogen hydrolase n=1 Tax=Anaeroselena agilis TaxID=3063788 RepID=A0ABU3P3H9_9FIRM|nr:nitrilase-related carbon-nitrogen hydrolase [Selenomonadales bacterium 4137-cl]